MSRAASVLIALLLATTAGCGDSDDVTSTAGSTSPATTSTEADEVEAPSGEEPEVEAGAGTDDVSPAPELSRDQVVDAVLTGSVDAALICDRLATERFVREAYGARQGCIAAQRPGALADSVEIEDTAEGEDVATVTVIPSGGPYDGVEVEIELVADGEGWRVDSLFADVPAGP